MTQDRHERPPNVFFAASDWLGGCATLPPMAEWVYLQISLYNMDKGEPVPANRLSMILVRHGGDWQSDLDLLIEIGKIHKTDAGGIFVKRSLTEYNRAENALTKKRNAGKKGAQKRWNTKGKDSTAKENDGSANGNANEKACDTNASRAEQSREKEISNDISNPQTPLDMLDTINPDMWQAFVEHRIKLKAPMTDKAATMIRNKLRKYQEELGHDPNAILEQSIMRGWKGVFELKDDYDGNGSGWDWTNQ